MAPIAQVSRVILKKNLAVETPEGAGALVRRSIGSINLRNLTPFLLLDHFHLKEGSGFPDHPHRGQATVTYMLEGSNQHEDSAGHKGIIVRGGVQWMCAGKGIIHAEIPMHVPGSPDPCGLQLWVDLPKQYKMADPSYQELSPDQVPIAHPEGVDGSVEIKVISGISHGVESPVRPLGGCWFFHILFKKEGTMFQDLPSGWTSFLYMLKGSLTVGPGPEVVPVDVFNTAILSSDASQTGVSLCGVEGAELVLIAGEPLEQTVFQYGPFVMTSKEEIQSTLLDYQNGRNGFERAHTWKSEIAQK